jgi:serine protease Do
MKKTSIIIALASFIAGLMLAAIVFMNYPPTEDTAQVSQGLQPAPELNSQLYASGLPVAQSVRTDLNFADIAESISPAVVYIEAEKVEKVQMRGFFDSPLEDFWRRFFDEPEEREQERRSTSSGTGFFISEEGLCVTNNHVVENSVDIRVLSLEGKEFKAEVIGTDAESDLALIKVKGEDFPHVALGKSDALKVGEWVVAIGNPLGLNHTVTAGIVSAKGRLFPDLNLPYQDFVQTDAAINRGNSGGPLLNMSGEVVGINTLIFGPTGGNIGIGFAISSDLAKKVIAQLQENGRVIRGWLGVSVVAITEDTKETFEVDEAKGAWIYTVEDDSPADKAKLQKYDVITAVDGEPVEDSNDLTFRIAEIKPGTRVDMTIVREGKERQVEVKIGEKDENKPEKPEATSESELGLGVTEMTPRIARQYGYRSTEGLVITEIKPNSEADRKGLKMGDLILDADRQKMETVKDLENIIDKKKPGQVILLNVRREGRGRTQDFIVTLRIPE